MVSEDTVLLLKVIATIIGLILAFIVWRYLITTAIKDSKKEKRAVLLVMLAFAMSSYFGPIMDEANKRFLSDQSSNPIIFLLQGFLWLLIFAVLFGLVLGLYSALKSVFDLNED